MFDIYKKYPEDVVIGVSCNSDDPTIVFDGGDTLEGWLQETYRMSESGLEYSAWDSGGYQTGLNVKARRATFSELKLRILRGDVPLPKPSNRRGLDLINSVINGISENETRRRIAQVRDALNKCRDPERIEAAARVFGL